jgi:hypothetical protein
MPMVTVVSEDGMAVVAADASDSDFRHRFSWSAAFAGAVVGTAVIFFLLTLGAGVGLSLVPAKGVTSSSFLTLGAIYFLAAQAMGFAVGGHLVGRLIGPMAETDREEEFRAAAHGLTVWGLCVTATATLVLLTSWVAAGSSAVAGGMALMPGNSIASPNSALSAYWTDVLFRPAAAPMHASLAWRQYAQANNTATDANPSTDDEAAPPSTVTPMTPVPAQSQSGKVENDVPKATTETAAPPPAPATEPHVITIPAESDQDPGTAAAAPTPTATSRGLPADKAEVGRLLETGMANGGSLQSYDRDRIVDLVSQDTGIGTAEASRRVDNALTRIHDSQVKTAESARKAARNASLWIALALLFGAIVSVMAAISARWEDDRITFGWPGRSEPV